MGKPVPMPFWVPDWLESETVDSMTAKEERGYLRLLAKCWIGPGCSLPDDEERLARWARMDAPADSDPNGDPIGNPISTLPTIVRECFDEHPELPGRLTNLKLLELWKETFKRKAKAAESGKVGAAKRWKQDSDPNGDPIGNPNGESMASPSPSPSYKEREPRDPSSTECVPPSAEALCRSRTALKALTAWKPDHRLALRWSDALLRTWAVDIDAAVNFDGRSWERVDRLLAGLPSLSFWASKVFNEKLGAKLREHFDAIEAEMSKPTKTPAAAQAEAQAAKERAASKAKLAELREAEKRATAAPPVDIKALVRGLAGSKGL